MEYKILLPEFEGPFDLLLHLIKQSDIDIYDIQIEVIVKQYMDYLSAMEQMNLSIAGEYLVMASELMEIKSKMLLPKPKMETDDEYEEDPREELVQRLLEYERYKKVTPEFERLEQLRSEFYTKEVSDSREFRDDSENVQVDATLDDLLKAFESFLSRKELSKPLNTKITKKEYSVAVRNDEIRSILKKRRRVSFDELFEEVTKEYVVVTFLSILDLARKQEIMIEQDDNFKNIHLAWNGVSL